MRRAYWQSLFYLRVYLRGVFRVACWMQLATMVRDSAHDSSTCSRGPAFLDRRTNATQSSSVTSSGNGPPVASVGRCWDPKPKCVLVAGRPGSGKTTLAKQLTNLLHMPMLSRDEIEEGFVTTFGISHDRLPADANREATELFLAATRLLLRNTWPESDDHRFGCPHLKI